MPDEDRAQGLLRDLLHDDRWSLPSWPDAPSRVRRAARRQRLRVAGAAAGLGAVVVAAAIALPGTFPGGGGGGTVRPAISAGPAGPSTAFVLTFGRTSTFGNATTVTPINTATGRDRRAIAVPGADEMTMSPDGAAVYVNGSRGVTVISTATSRVIKLLNVHSAGAMAVSPDGKTLWVGIGREVIPFSTVTGDHGWATRLPKGTPQKIVITPDNRTVYVTAYPSNEVTPIQVSTGLARQPINVGGQPGPIAVAPGGKVVYVGSAGRVTPISAATSTVPSAALPPIRFQGAPGDIAFSPDGRTAYIMVETPGTVIRVQVASSTALPAFKLPRFFEPSGIAVAPDGKTAYLANAGLGENTVRSINLRTGAVRSITVGYSPVRVAITPDGKTVYTGDAATGPGILQNGDLVTPVRTSTGRAGPPIKVGGRPDEIVLSP
jgi:DNA-binding beta-propeller fold protein YncE